MLSLAFHDGPRTENRGVKTEGSSRWLAELRSFTPDARAALEIGLAVRGQVLTLHFAHLDPTTCVLLDTPASMNETLSEIED